MKRFESMKAQRAAEALYRKQLLEKDLMLEAKAKKDAELNRAMLKEVSQMREEAYFNRKVAVAIEGAQQFRDQQNAIEAAARIQAEKEVFRKIRLQREKNKRRAKSIEHNQLHARRFTEVADAHRAAETERKRLWETKMKLLEEKDKRSIALRKEIDLFRVNALMSRGGDRAAVSQVESNRIQMDKERTLLIQQREQKVLNPSYLTPFVH